MENERFLQNIYNQIPEKLQHFCEEPLIAIIIRWKFRQQWQIGDKTSCIKTYTYGIFSCKNNCTRSRKRNIQLRGNFRTCSASWTWKKTETKWHCSKTKWWCFKCQALYRVYSIKDDAFLQVDTSSQLFLHIRRRNALL